MSLHLSASMRFALAISAVFVGAALVAGILAYALQTAQMRRALEAEVAADTRSLALAARDGDVQDLRDQVAARIAVAGDGARIVAFQPAAGGPVQGNALTAQFEGARRLTPGPDLQLTPPGGQPGEGYLAFGMSLPEGWIMTGRDDAMLQEQTEILAGSFGWGLGLAALLATGLAIVIARRTEVRIGRMEAVLAAVGSGQHALRIADAGADDLARLAQSVDAALDRLEAGIAAIRQVSTDVAHDLRAPLARLRLRLEPLAMDAAMPAVARAELGLSLADLDQIAETFDAILRLARMQAGMVEIALAPVDLAALCRDVVEMMAPSAEDMGHRLSLDLAASATISGDRALLAQALINLIDNALRHCPAPAQVRLALLRTDTAVVLEVRDDGPGIPETDLARVRDRFVRLDHSRNTPGSGLGLSLVEAIATLHHARLDLANGKPGLCARFVFSAR